MEQGFKLSKTWYYILSFTWGILLTSIGCLLSLLLILLGQKPKENRYGWYFTLGLGWGGFSIGPCSIVCTDVKERTLAHEFGHSIQNCLFGPLMIPYVVIPSICRYWYRKKKNITSPPYDAIWFEGMATIVGLKY